MTESEEGFEAVKLSCDKIRRDVRRMVEDAFDLNARKEVFMGWQDRHVSVAFAYSAYATAASNLERGKADVERELLDLDVMLMWAVRALYRELEVVR